VLVNEIAPRPHNSGHHTIEANMVSQYEQHLRAILNLPLGSTTLRCPAVMVNLLGEENFEGKALYEGMQQALEMPGVTIHLYGKKNTKPFRKMGHVTIVDTSLEGAKAKAKIVKETLKVKA
jgi:5-(carboxyamino)imidazole ribonucleotide synthase